MTLKPHLRVECQHLQCLVVPLYNRHIPAEGGRSTVRLQLSDGTFIDASLLTATSKSSSRRRENAPSKRQAKQGGGGLKRANSRKALSSCGSPAHNNPAHMDPLAPLCIVTTSQPISPAQARIHKLRYVDASRFTTNLGGSTHAPYQGGRGM